MKELELRGLNGNNLLAFLAAVGTLRVLASERPEWGPRLKWVNRGVWKPVLCLATLVSEEQLIDMLHRHLSGRVDAPEFNWTQDLSVTPDEFRSILVQAVDESDSKNRSLADWCAAFGTEILMTKQGKIQDTPLRTMSGSGHQHFVGFMRKLAAETTMEQIGQALFQDWEYRDPSPSMRWDPADDRRYAYRGDDPSGSKNYPILCVRGANRLAVEALPCFPTAPARSALRMPSVFYSGRAVSVTWPIWEPAISATILCSLLSHPELVESQPRRSLLTPIGVREVFRSERITIGKFRNFKPAFPCMT